MDKAKQVIQELLDAADYIEEGGCLDALSHAPDGGSKWYEAIEKAKVFLEEEKC